MAVGFLEAASAGKTKMCAFWIFNSAAGAFDKTFGIAGSLMLMRNFFGGSCSKSGFPFVIFGMVCFVCASGMFFIAVAVMRSSAFGTDDNIVIFREVLFAIGAGRTVKTVHRISFRKLFRFFIDNIIIIRFSTDKSKYF